MRLEHWLYSLPLKWRSLVRRRQLERDLDDEIRDHLESQVEENVARGMDRRCPQGGSRRSTARWPARPPG
jgi:hypothetical protein